MTGGVKRIILSGAILSIQIWIPFAWCSENEGYASPIQKSSEKSARSDAGEKVSAQTVFNRRWPSASKEFVVGADGIAAAAENGRGATGQANDAGNTAIAYAATGSLSDFVGTANSNLSDKSRDATSSGSTVSSVPECGPSPLPAEKIKMLVEEAARRHQVDEHFANAIAWTESQFDRSRNSDKGARGPMQLMPDTAARFDVRDVCDPEANIEGGMKYLRFLLDEFRNPLLVAAAYNAGESRVYEYGGIPPFKETVSYVAKVVNYQLGISMPAPKNKLSGKYTKSAPAAANSPESGVIAVKKIGTFVGGVMRF